MRKLFQIKPGEFPLEIKWLIQNKIKVLIILLFAYVSYLIISTFLCLPSNHNILLTNDSLLDQIGFNLPNDSVQMILMFNSEM